MKLTLECHRYITSLLKEGDYAIDATIGNGHDMVFLAKIVGSKGKVVGFDIQQQALDNTFALLKQENLSNQVILVCKGHELMNQFVPLCFLGSTKIITFNLGYLPGSDKSIITKPKSTILAFENALLLLCKGGSLVVMVYTGHDGGTEEWIVIQEWLQLLDVAKYSFNFIVPCSPRKEVPKLFVIQRRDFV